MMRLLRAFGPVVLVLAAADAYLARTTVPHREVDPRLFLQALALWAAFTAIALVPAAATQAVLARRRSARTPDAPQPTTVGAAAVLAFWAALPVVLHHRLDAFTGSGQDLTRLRAAGPWLLALGVGAALALIAWAAARVLRRVPQRSLLVAAGAAALAVGLFLPRAERPSELRDVGDATGKPNLMLLVWDTCRADHTAPYGYERETTPHLARFAEDALVFEEARSATIFTFTSHLTMLTGVMPSVHGARLLSTRYDPRKATTIAEILRAEGYRTGGFVGTDVLAGRTGIRHGFEVYSDQVDPPVCDTYAWKLVHDLQAILALRVRALRNNGLPHWFQDFQRPAPGVLADALEWIERDDPRPWFCMINLYDVHWPYVPGPEARDVLVREYNGAFDGYLFRSDAYVEGTVPSAEDAQHLRDLYDAELLQLDRDVAAFLGALDLEHIGVVLTADHGEAFGEAGTWKHENIFEPQLTVPMLVRLPGATRKGRVATRAAGVDVAPTLLGMAGIPIPAVVQGADLSHEVPDPERVILVEDSDSMNPEMIRLALYRGRWKLCRHGKLDAYTYTLHDLETDRVGEHDVSAEHPAVAAELIAMLVEIRGDLDRLLAEQELDLGASRDALQALGYAGEED
jgi:arylsulfatase A-like enzyme